MSVAKVVRIRVGEDSAAPLDRALDTAGQAFDAETGTIHWGVYASSRADERVLIEVFADEGAVRLHDASPAVAILLDVFVRLGVDVISADQFPPSPLPSEAGVIKEK